MGAEYLADPFPDSVAHRFRPVRFPCPSRSPVHERREPQLLAEVLQSMLFVQVVPSGAGLVDDLLRQGFLTHRDASKKSPGHARDLVRDHEQLERTGHGALEETRIVNQIHDAVMVEAPISEIEATKEMFQATMGSIDIPIEYGEPLRLGIDIEVLDRWGVERQEQ